MDYFLVVGLVIVAIVGRIVAFRFFGNWGIPLVGLVVLMLYVLKKGEWSTSGVVEYLESLFREKRTRRPGVPPLLRVGDEEPVFRRAGRGRTRFSDAPLDDVPSVRPTLERLRQRRRVYKGRTPAQVERIRRAIKRSSEHKDRLSDITDEEEEEEDSEPPLKKEEEAAAADHKPCEELDSDDDDPLRDLREGKVVIKSSLQLLKHIQLPQYSGLLEREALTNIPLLKSMAKNDVEQLRSALDSAGLKRVGHREAIIAALRALR